MSNTAAHKHILLVEDEQDIANLIHFHLVNAGYKVTLAHNGLLALESVKDYNFDLIVLDLMIPKVDGMTVFKTLRGKAKTKHIPVIILSAKGQPSDRIAGLEAGADDYITKPFSPKELILRIGKQLKAVKKREESHILQVKDFTFNKMDLSFAQNGERIDLTSIEFKLLLQLCENPNQVQLRADLLKQVWGYSDSVNSRTLDTHMKRIRIKIGSIADDIKTVRGKGYMFFIED